MLNLEPYLRSMLRPFPVFHQRVCKMLGHHVVISTSSVDAVIELHAYCESCRIALYDSVIDGRTDAAGQLEQKIEAITDVMKRNSRHRSFDVVES